ncbi:dihydrofolate reductase [Dyadobacter sp. BE34]|uniref:Dihydrofolate reductase n=1 Tax=Dyadobacter fermentans TaxID=94254 RepID=A0ABU1QRJ7_9BACT|nr:MULTISPECIES: dihydrofolate reductase [Dyadobacter]MDR6803794.1 dihydrofolate reductase [Dyadobacter fermentans]MDR7041534.1 dihydrofolate reductase [Dyadobacter sp. BE242]MDR7195937.1 dihydrofolate reductase [Dyadobacter sp. BE34]MDR7213518.1 dihydrofolate reductase [Dyadobacter sp. BE31]MDR7261343.1 dihydrofolate reductase [Dyadobacter sp. BE32]
MHISIIVAAAENGAIGKDNQLLWRLPDDLKRFKQLTLGHPMIMGRKTFESIGKPLPGRTSIVITRSADFAFEGVIVVHSLEEALKKAKEIDEKEACIVGGGEIYRQSQDIATHIYLTRVHTEIEGDTFFEIENPDAWTETERVLHEPDERHFFPFEFINYIKKADK